MTNVLTLKLDEASQAFFEGMRRKHFPPERNQIPAHLTLFHTLPDNARVWDVLGAASARQARFRMRVTGLRSLGKGVAYTLASGDLARLQGELAGAFAEDITAQDKQKFGPHVVVQNKTTPERALALLAELESSFEVFAVEAVGLELWHYLGGPWELAATFLFRQAS